MVDIPLYARRASIGWVEATTFANRLTPIWDRRALNVCGSWKCLAQPPETDPPAALTMPCERSSKWQDLAPPAFVVDFEQSSKRSSKSSNSDSHGPAADRRRTGQPRPGPCS